MVYVVKGDTVLLSQTALIDLGVIPQTFPQIGQFGGNVETGDGICRFDSNMMYLKEQSHLPMTVAEVGTENSRLLGTQAAETHEETNVVVLPASDFANPYTAGQVP
jgi:hypothetical protein